MIAVRRNFNKFARRSLASVPKQNDNRIYFYTIDMKGNLYHDDYYNSTLNPYNRLNDANFLDYFFKVLRHNDSDNYSSNYPFVSVCWNELNFVRYTDDICSLVFKDILEHHSENLILTYGGSLRQKFDPSCMALSEKTGRLYHSVSNHKHLVGSYGLLHPSICEFISSNIIEDKESSKYILNWNNVQYELKCIYAQSHRKESSTL